MSDNCIDVAGVVKESDALLAELDKKKEERK
jgi:hypothetical protein